jgi:hypothetical protein
MRNEFTAIVEQDDLLHIAYCVEAPGANGWGKSREECLGEPSRSDCLHPGVPFRALGARPVCYKPFIGTGAKSAFLGKRLFYFGPRTGAAAGVRGEGKEEKPGN